MTPFQADLFSEFSEKIVCLDSTHRTNQYKHKLVTMVVPDAFHNGMIAPLQTNKLHVVYIHTHLGCPVAWLISNREDEATLTMLLRP